MTMEAVLTRARSLGLPEVQWQAPHWNEGAIRFCDRLGAHAQDKRRCTLPVTPT
ncbi:hypothetical protein [Streptomyces iconiensis]|uniref:Acetyltransferase n=1 Tax=Streptomyces iconiensis TaxID=1384038 RepID=A0ABT6ZT19_9ACTN|nr:hypothetical protein [Streptomyces iconiensis]MDJ1132205.1 hypothetical protein [Streptomyces iconiensis]